MDKWINTIDDYPPLETDVLVYLHSGEINIASWEGSNLGWIDFDGGSVKMVTHWMPLPEAPSV